LATRLLQQPRIDNSVAENWIHGIEVDIADIRDWYRHLNDLLVILMRTRYLRAFRYRHGISTSHLSCLALTPGPRLVILDMIISPGDEECISLVGNMDSLEDLTMHFSEPSVDMTHVAPLSLPQVRHLTIQWPHEFKADFATFIFSSSFTSLRSAYLVLNQLTREFTPKFATFLTNREKCLDELSLDVPQEIVTEAKISLLKCAKNLIFLTSVPPITLMDEWSRSSPLRHLTVRATLSSDSLWDLLENLQAASNRDFKDSGFSVVITLHDHRFSWESGKESEKLASFIGKLVYFARKLYNRGIHILDEDGQTILG
jgi:hypothetical protein